MEIRVAVIDKFRIRISGLPLQYPINPFDWNTVCVYTHLKREILFYSTSLLHFVSVLVFVSFINYSAGCVCDSTKIVRAKSI